MLIGKEVSVKDTGLRGTVIDETKNTLVVESVGKSKRIIKDKNRFVVYENGIEKKIRGEEINLRPWEYAI
ncbi:MAG: ribonuclease P protein subunit [Candidatus Parvarchaeota archaeon]|jgi:RNase P/RNase MRP subunit p29|nr:ribonuclease P protein subunit [Candidatus Parvarchaeota archaeon]MCL5101027.1 ribonuclease P protein subunit [Candidatus Parvarchaeota archaeon]